MPRSTKKVILTQYLKPMTKELNLTIGERVMVAKLFDEMAKETNLETLSLLIDEMKKVAMTPAEWEAAKLVKTPHPDGSESWKWEDEGSGKDFELQDKTVDLLKARIKAKNDANQFSMTDVAAITLNNKL